MTFFRPTLGISVVAIALFATGAAPAHAAGQYDGTWIIDLAAPRTTVADPSSQCPAARFPISVKNNVISGSLERKAAINTNTIGPGYSGNALPLKGTVAADGSFTVEWSGYKAAGKLQGASGTIAVRGSCGARTGVANRL